MFLLLYKRKTENMPRLIETTLGYFEISIKLKK
jgi:hypothetical protein